MVISEVFFAHYSVFHIILGAFHNILGAFSIVSQCFLAFLIDNLSFQLHFVSFWGAFHTILWLFWQCGRNPIHIFSDLPKLKVDI